MCGRYTLTILPDESKIVYPAGGEAPLQPHYNIVSPAVGNVRNDVPELIEPI